MSRKKPFKNNDLLGGIGVRAEVVAAVTGTCTLWMNFHRVNPGQAFPC
jgi:hypothetical protein